MSQLSDFELPKCWGRKNHKGVLAQFAGKFRDGRFGTDEVTTIRLLFRCAEDGGYLSVPNRPRIVLAKVAVYLEPNMHKKTTSTDRISSRGTVDSCIDVDDVLSVAI